MHLGFNPTYIFFGEPSGSLTLDPAKLANSKVEITIPLANLRTNVDKFIDHLKSPDFFDAAKYPEIKFVSIRSEDHTSELHSLMRISYAVLCLKKTTNHQHN